MKRCLQGNPQNLNESQHVRIWKLCSKVKSLGKSTLDFVVTQATMTYNVGYEQGYLGKELGIMNENTFKYLRDLDKEREKVRLSRPRKRRKIRDDDAYAPGAYY